jgi:hypothetical protein
VLIRGKHGDLSILARPPGCIVQWPSTIAPWCTTRLGAISLPNTLAEGRSSMRRVPMMSPLTLPATMIDVAIIGAVTTALSPIKILSLATISSIWPSISAGPEVQFAVYLGTLV